MPLIKLGLTVALSASLLSVVTTAPANAAVPPPVCVAHDAPPPWPMAATVSAETESTTIPGGITVASTPSDKLSAIGGRNLVPDVAAAGNYLFNWKYPPYGTAPTTYPNPRGWAVQFAVKGTQNIEFEVYARQKAAWTMSVDGRPTSAVPDTEPAITDGRYLIRYPLPDTGEHRIRFSMNNLSLGRVFADPAAEAEVWPVGGPRVFFLGDSLTQGGAQSTGGEIGSWIWAFAQMCGFDDAWNGGIGGTGSIATGRDGLWADYGTRAATDVAPAAPDLVFITSYYGDRTHPPGEIAAAFTRTIETIRALPSQPAIVVTGTYDPDGRNGSPYTQIDSALAAACASLGVPYIEPRTGLVYDAAGAPLAPAGAAGPWITPDNKGTLIGPDGVHQSDAGQAYTAQRMYDAYRALSAGGV